MSKHPLLITICTALLTAMPLIQAADTSSRYQTWNPPAGETVFGATGNATDNEKYQKMIDELNQLIDDAEKVRAADRRFIQDLRDVLNQFDWPWRNQVLSEDFTDGIVSKNPAWVIDSGDFKIERGLGMHSHIDAPKPTQSKKSSDDELAAAILGAILDSATKDKKNSSSSRYSKPTQANIHVSRKINNAFALKTSIDPRSSEGRIAIRFYQGSHTGTSYQLVLITGKTTSVELQRVSSRGTSIIDVKDNLKIDDNQSHKLQWTRDTRGNMTVELNGKLILQVADRSLRDPFSGLSVSNQGGTFYLRSVSVSDVL